jgi:flagellar FliL protein
MNTMAEAAEETPKSIPKKSGGIMATLVNGIAIFVLTLGAVIAGGFVNTALHPMPDLKLGPDGKITAVKPPPPVERAGHGDEGGKPTYFAIDPPLVVNFEDNSAVRFLQISMEVMVRDPKDLDLVEKNVPLVRNNLLLLMSNRNYQTLMSREGKEKLREEALAEIRNIVKKEGGSNVDDLLFTSFVVQ